MTTVPRVCFYLGRTNCLDKYFRVDSPIPPSKKKKKNEVGGERIWLMFSATWGKLPETADLRSLRDLKPWGVLSSAEIAGSWKTRKRGDAVLPKCLLSLERSYSIKQKVSCECLCLFLWRNKGGFRRRCEMGKGFRTTCFSRNWFSGHWLVKKQKQKQTNSRDT